MHSRQILKVLFPIDCREERMSLENHIVLWELENEGGRKQVKESFNN